jgi:hypothetical protein
MIFNCGLAGIPGIAVRTSSVGSVTGIVITLVSAMTVGVVTGVADVRVVTVVNCWAVGDEKHPAERRNAKRKIPER